MLGQLLIKCHLIFSLHLRGVVSTHLTSHRRGTAAVKISHVASVLSVGFDEERKSGVKARLSWLAGRKWREKLLFDGLCKTVGVYSRLLASTKALHDNFE